MRAGRAKPSALTQLERTALPFCSPGEQAVLTPIQSAVEELEKSPVHRNLLHNLEKAFRKESKRRIYKSMPAELKLRSPQTMQWRSGSVLAFSLPFQKKAEPERRKEEKKSVVKALHELQRREQRLQQRSKRRLEVLD